MADIVWRSCVVPMLITTHTRLFLLGVVGIGNRICRQNWASGSLTFTLSHRSCQTVVFNAFSPFLALPTCCCPLRLSTLGGLVDLETFFSVSPNLVGDTALTVAAHTFRNISIQYVFSLKPDCVMYCHDCIMT